MIDSEEMDMFWDTWTSPPNTKNKKKSKKDRKQKNNQINKTYDSSEKKKKSKSCKLSQPPERKKEKRKGKKKKSRSLRLDPKVENVANLKRLITENPESSGFKKETKKKKVTFDTKRPQCVLCSLRSPEENTGTVEVGGDRPQTTATGNDQSQLVNEDSQCPSEDLQSQDLFITQKIFQSPISQTSSSENSEKAAVVTSTQCHKQTNVVKIPSQDLGFYQRKATPKKNTLVPLFSQEDDDDDKVDSLFVQTQKQSNTKHIKYKSPSRHSSIKPKMVNPFLDAPTVVDDTKSTKTSTSSLNAFTQTENFFTTELSSYLSFCQKNTSSHLVDDDDGPLDLSLANRVRNVRDAGSKTPVIVIEDDPEIKSDQEPHLQEGGGAKGCSGSGRVSSGSVQGNGRKTPSSPSESESKSTETTGSGEDTEGPCHHNRVDVMQFQVRTVQMRLNESFYFKPKGEGCSPRPNSPLMKLSQGRGFKSRKRK